MCLFLGSYWISKEEDVGVKSGGFDIEMEGNFQVEGKAKCQIYVKIGLEVDRLKLGQEDRVLGGIRKLKMILVDYWIRFNVSMDQIYFLSLCKRFLEFGNLKY